MTKYYVTYLGGVRMDGEGECDYMLAYVPDPYDIGGYVRLYAEADPFDYGATLDENGEIVWTEIETYEPLRQMIIEQAKEKGVDPDCLVFHFEDLDLDEEERKNLICLTSDPND